MENTNIPRQQRILVVNPRSCFTKVAIYDENKLVYLNKIQHSAADCHKYPRIIDQYDFRKEAVLKELRNADWDTWRITAVVGRGGMLKPVKSGVYEVNEKLKYDLIHNPAGEDSVNLGALLADDIARSIENAKAYICDPIVVDEMDEVARISGHPDFPRKSIFHALNQKAVARKYAKSVLKNYEDLNLIIAHLGVGITVGAHSGGRVIDVNQGFDGTGPFSPKRSGTLPAGDLVRMCFSGQFTQEQMQHKVMGEGGLMAWLGTDDLSLAETMGYEEGSEKARLIFEAMAYQVAKEIGSLYPVLNGQVDAIILTGGIANSHRFIQYIINRVQKIAPVMVYPGGDEMEALALNVLEVLRGQKKAHIYE